MGWRRFECPRPHAIHNVMALQAGTKRRPEKVDRTSCGDGIADRDDLFAFLDRAAGGQRVRYDLRLLRSSFLDGTAHAAAGDDARPAPRDDLRHDRHHSGASYCDTAERTTLLGRTFHDSDRADLPGDGRYRDRTAAGGQES